MNYDELKTKALKLDWTCRLRLAQELLESLHHKAPAKPVVVDRPVAPSGLSAEDFGVLGLEDTVPVARDVSITQVPSLELGEGTGITESFQKLREALESKVEGSS